MCKLCGNKTWCTAQAYVKDGVMLSFAGDPENAASGGKLCNRGQAAMMNVYNPYRVKAPDEAHQSRRRAWTRIPAGWRSAGTRRSTPSPPRCGRSPNGEIARRFAHCFGFASWANIVSDEAFCRAFGSPYDIQGRGHLCPVHIGASFVNGTFLDKQDVEYANYFLDHRRQPGPQHG